MPLELEIPLKGEMPIQDFCLPVITPEGKKDEKYAGIGLFDSWLNATVDGGYQWSGGKDYEDHQRDLAKFLNAEAKGPYFVVPGYINTKGTLAFVFMERSDADAFIGKFGESHHYRLQEDSFEENLRTFALWSRQAKWEPEDPRLTAYVEKALTL